MTQTVLPDWLRALIVGGTAITLVALEFRQALRPRRRESKPVRIGRNLVLAGTAGLVMNALETPLAMRLARHVEANNLGLAPTLTNFPVARVVIAVLLLDYGLYLWHVLTHRVPFLWRFHLVHHIDLDMDVSTAVRFHFGEMLLSIPWRVAQIALAGASPMAVSVWQTGLLASILFHHSNVRLPFGLERRLRLLIVTPRIHGVHHRPEPSCLNSNWSSGLAIWDLLHGTHRWKEDPTERVGVPGYEEPEDATLRNCLTLPFRAQALNPPEASRPHPWTAGASDRD